MVTPLLDNKKLDNDGLGRLVEHLVTGGVHGLFILGTTGEGTSLSCALRRELIVLTIELVNGRIPVFVGISDTSLLESQSLAQFAAEAGAAAVVATPPFYFGMGQTELVAYFTALADNISIPLFLYNIPSHTKIIIAPATVKILSSHPQIIGLKDSSGNAVYFNSLLYLMEENSSFSLLVGPEEMMASAVLLGGHGGVNGGANIFPKLYVNLFQACVARDFSQITFLQKKVMEISQKIYEVGNSGTAYLQGLKAALSVLGICNDFLASPLGRFGELEKALIKKNLEGLSSREFHRYPGGNLQ